MAAVLVLLGACGDAVVVEPEPGGAEPSVASSIALSANNVSLAAVGQTFQVTATVRDQRGDHLPTAPVTWLLSDSTVVSVSSDGLLTATRNGFSTLRASSGSVTSGALPIRVRQRTATVDVALSSHNVQPGGTLQATATPRDGNGFPMPGNIEWSVDAPRVATVDDRGRVVALGDGLVRVRATELDFRRSGEHPLSVATAFEENPVETRTDSSGAAHAYSATFGGDHFVVTVTDAGTPVEEVTALYTESGQEAVVSLLDTDGRYSPVLVVGDPRLWRPASAPERVVDLSVTPATEGGLRIAAVTVAPGRTWRARGLEPRAFVPTDVVLPPRAPADPLCTTTDELVTLLAGMQRDASRAAAGELIAVRSASTQASASGAALLVNAVAADLFDDDPAADPTFGPGDLADVWQDAWGFAPGDLPQPDHRWRVSETSVGLATTAAGTSVSRWAVVTLDHEDPFCIVGVPSSVERVTRAVTTPAGTIAHVGVRVRNQFGEPLAGVRVDFATAVGGGSLDGTASAASESGSDGIATVGWSPPPGGGSHEVIASARYEGQHVSGSPLSITATVATPEGLGSGFDDDEFTLLPAGTFRMGDIGGVIGASDERPVHDVTLSRAFFVQKTEVTQGQWRSVMGSNPAAFFACGNACPVERVTWDEAQEFVERLNALRPGSHYRLPTEAEWEYAARAGTVTDYGGNGVLDDLGWCGENASGTTHAVAGKRANDWGLYDMHGNVYEWVQDWGSATYYAESPELDPPGPPSGTQRGIRGGGWRSNPVRCSSAARSSFVPSIATDFIGFRLARTPS